MSSELIAVLPGSEAPDRWKWQAALTALDLPWHFETSADPGAAKGFCPMRAGKVVSGVEIHGDGLEAVPGDPGWTALHQVIAFRWGGDLLECACAFSAAAGLMEAFAAVVYDPAEGPTPIGLPRLREMAAMLTMEALEQSSRALTVQKVVRAVSRMPDIDWCCIVDSSVVCRSIEGHYLRGLAIDRTSAPGVYRFRVIQLLWCMLGQHIHVNDCFEMKDWLSGGLERIVDGVRQEFANDDGIRRCVLADPGQPWIFDPRFYPGEPGGDPHIWVDRAVMRALDGNGAAALPVLRRVVEDYPDKALAGSGHRWSIIPEVIACLERGGDVGATLQPHTEAAKARFSIKPIRRRASARSPNKKA